MSGLTNALNIGRSSLLAGQKAIEVTGNNISNVNTPGYSRQIPVFSDYPSLNMKGYAVGRGTKIELVDREHDQFLSTQVQQKNADLGEEEAKATPLAELERILSISESGLSAAIDDFFQSLQDLTADPGSRVARDVVIQNGKLLAQSFHSSIGELEELQENMNATLKSRLNDLNLKFREIADLNERISNIEITGQVALADRDRRDLLLEQVSYALGATSSEGANGMVSVYLPSGQALVQDKTAVSLSAEQKTDKLEIYVEAGSTQFELLPDRVGGEFRGLLYLRDEFIPQVMDDIDKLAFGMISEVNRVHQWGTGLDGVTGRSFFTPTTQQSGAARAIGVALGSYLEVAAGRSSAPGDNTNALDLSALSQQRLIDGQETFLGFYSRIAGEVGVEANRNKLALAGNQDALIQVTNLRDSKVGVSLEEEMITLIKYQKNFEASAKYLSTVDEMMDALISLKR